MPKRTQLVTPLSKVEAIPDFFGHEVIAVGVEAPGIGGGLADALLVDPVVLDMGEEFAIVIRGRCKRISHEPYDRSKMDGPLRRVHVMAVEEAGVVPVDAVESLLASQRDAIDAAVVAAEKSQGIHRLPVDGDGDDFVEDDAEAAAERSHNQGLHSDGLRSECRLCVAEAEASADENGTTLEEELERQAVGP